MTAVVVASEFMGRGMGGWSKDEWGLVGGYLVRLLGTVRCIKWYLRAGGQRRGWAEWVCGNASRCLVSPRVDGNMNDTLMVRTYGLDLPVR